MIIDTDGEPRWETDPLFGLKNFIGLWGFYICPIIIVVIVVIVIIITVIIKKKK